MRPRLLGWCGVVLSLAAASLMISGPPAAGVAGYGDVAEDTYYAKAVQWSVNQGITGLDGACFAPDSPVSRGETAQIIWNMQGQPSAVPHSFTDVTVESQNPAISWMLEVGITTGTSDTTFSPEQTLERAQLAALLHRLAGEPAAGPHPFTDVVRDWQHAPVSWMAANKITTGTTPTTFEPEGTLKRAHLITFLYRYQGEPEVTIDLQTPACHPTADDTPTTDIYSFKAVAAGSDHACGLLTDATVTCWGDNTYRQAEPPTGSFQSIASGGSHTCGLRTDNSITCWGANWYGQATAPAGRFQAVTSGFNHTCGLRTDGIITCWGHHLSGQAIPPAGRFQSVFTGGGYRGGRAFHACGLRTDGTITCWGDNGFGQSDAQTGSFKAVSAGGLHSCGLRTDDTVTCWGSNAYGQADAQTGSFKAVTASSGRGLHTCGLRTDDTVTCWGSNSKGQTEAPRRLLSNADFARTASL